jgi:putative membrane protein
MNTVRALLVRRESRAALAVWVALPTIFLFFNLTLAVDPAAHVDQLSLGAVVLDAGVATPQGQVAVGPKLVGALGERLGVKVVAYPTENALRDAILARDVTGGIVVPDGMTADLQAGRPIELTVARSDANDQFSNGFTASLANSLAPTLNAALPSMLGGTPVQPLVTVATDNVAATTDFRFATMPGFLLLPLWIGGVAFALLLSRAGDRVRQQAGVSRTGLAEAAFTAVAAAVAAAVVAIDIALFTWTWDVNMLGLFAFLWVALTAIGWLLLGTVRTFGLALGAALGVVALFLQQPISGATYPPAFAPDVVRWAEPIAPLRYLVEGLRDVLIGGSTLADVTIALAWLAMAGLVLVVVGAGRLSLASRQHPTVHEAMPAA